MAATFVFYVFCFTLVPGLYAQAGCANNKADIVFLLDSSYSEGSSNFQKQVDFVANFTQAFDIGPNKVQIGVLTFSSSPHNAFYLNSHSTKASVLSALKTVRYVPGGTVTDKALQYVRDNSFLATHGGRYGVPKILVVMTDGQSSNPTATAAQARVLHYAGIKVIAIGIGSGVHADEINNIASDKQHAFTVTSFNSLQTIEHDIQNAACVSEKVESCDNKKADIIFVLDGSSSEGKLNFQKQLDFVANFTNSFDIGPNNIQIGLVTFGTQHHNEFYLNTYRDEFHLSAAIRHVRYIGGTTNTAEALRFVRQHGFLAENGGRGNTVSQLVVVLTDGKSNSHSQTVTEATNLHMSGVKVIAVGIGSAVTSSELVSIATDAQHAINVANFNSLDTVRTQIETAACSTPHVCGSKPTDVVFVLDASTSVGSTHFQKQLDFVTNFVKDYDVGPGALQVGLVTYSSTAHNEIYLNSYTDKLSLIAAIQSVRYRGGTTATDQGIRAARYYQFSKYHGGRVNASLAMVVLTGGHSADISKTLTEANVLKNAGVNIVAMGIGASANKYEISGIASDRDQAFTVGSYDILHTFKGEIEDETCGSSGPKPTAFPECGNKPADIVFLIDSSASEGATNFQKQVDFVRDFSYQFQIGPKDVQISVVTFSTRVVEVFPLNRYHSQSALLSALTHVSYISGATYTDVALKYVREHSFSSAKGGRAHVPKVVIVVTDGQSTHPNITQTEAIRLKAVTNMTVIAIGVGSRVGKAELAHIATDSHHMFSVASFDALQLVKSELTFVACKTCEFLTKADVVFIVDSTTSVGATNFHKQLDFVSRLVNDLKIGSTAIRVGLVTFGSSAHRQLYLNSISTKAGLLSSIQRIAYRPESTTHTDVALHYARLYMFGTYHGGRTSAHKYAILLTDGASTSHTKTLSEAESLKRMGVNIIAIGIGSHINKAELLSVASDVNHVMYANDFDALEDMTVNVKAAACQEVLTTTTVATTPTTTPTTTTERTTTPTTTTERTTTPTTTTERTTTPTTTTQTTRTTTPLSTSTAPHLTLWP